MRFSRHGTLERTIADLVEHSREGYFASELEALLQVRVHNALARLAGVKVKTVAEGCRQSLARNVTAERIREAGAGRPALKKPKSSPGSNS